MGELNEEDTNELSKRIGVFLSLVMVKWNVTVGEIGRKGT